MIQLDLTSDACQAYANFYGWTEDNEQSCEDFVTARLYESITNTLVEKRNRDAIEAAQSQPMPSITV